MTCACFNVVSKIEEKLKISYFGDFEFRSHMFVVFESQFAMNGQDTVAPRTPLEKKLLVAFCQVEKPGLGKCVAGSC